MSLSIILLILLVLVLVGAWPRWEHSREWGYTPVGMIVAILVVVLILILLGVL